MKHHLLLLVITLAVIDSCVGEDEPTHEPTHESTHETQEEDSMMFGDIEMKLSPELMEASVMQHNDPLHKMGPILATMYKQHQGGEPPNSFMLESSLKESFVHEDGTVSIDVVAMADGPDLQDMIDELKPHGFILLSTYRHMASGTIPIKSLGDMCKCSSMLMALPALSVVESLGRPMERRAKGSVTSEGVFAMEVDKVLEKFGFKGFGVTVGVLSDSFNALGGAQDDIASGDLPPAHRMNIVNDSFTESDEGRAMMQIIHDVAPGANLAFHTALDGIADFANGIKKLAEAECQVIVDDIFYPHEPAFQDGLIAQAVDEVTKSGVIYFASAGNYGRSSYESAFVDSRVIVDGPAGTVYRLHDWALGSDSVPDVFQAVFLPNTERLRLIFQWDEPFATATPGSQGSSSDLGMFILDPTLNRAVAISDQVNIGMDPIEIIGLNVTDHLQLIGRPNDLGHIFEIAIGLRSGNPPKRMKVTSLSNEVRFIEYPTNSATGYGHRNARGSIAVGATNWESTPRYGQVPPVIRSFSSALGTPILFDEKGKRLAKPEVRKQPKVTGPDGGINTFFPDPAFPRFRGTSASAPHAAAVAALLLSSDPSLGRNEIKDILKKTAVGMSDPMIPFSEEQRFDFRTGNGFVNASAAFEELLSRRGKEGNTRNLRVGSTRVLA